MQYNLSSPKSQGFYLFTTSTTASSSVWLPSSLSLHSECFRFSPTDDIVEPIVERVSHNVQFARIHRDKQSVQKLQAAAITVYRPKLPCASGICCKGFWVMCKRGLFSLHAVCEISENTAKNRSKLDVLRFWKVFYKKVRFFSSANQRWVVFMNGKMSWRTVFHCVCKLPYCLSDSLSKLKCCFANNWSLELQNITFSSFKVSFISLFSVGLYNVLSIRNNVCRRARIIL